MSEQVLNTISQYGADVYNALMRWEVISILFSDETFFNAITKIPQGLFLLLISLSVYLISRTLGNIINPVTDYMRNHYIKKLHEDYTEISIDLDEIKYTIDSIEESLEEIQKKRLK